MNQVSRLITYFVPSHYNLSLRIHREKRTFEGVVGIQGVVQNENELRLHAKDLVIEAAHVNGHQVAFRSEANDELVLEFTGLKDEQVTITLGFSGTITDQMHGMYPCYFQHDGQEKELLATQFESHHAREVFPCIEDRKSVV